MRSSAMSTNVWAILNEQHSSITKELGQKGEEGRASGNLNNACDRLGDFQQEVEYDKLHLSTAKGIG